MKKNTEKKTNILRLSLKLTFNQASFFSNAIKQNWVLCQVFSPMKNRYQTNALRMLEKQLFNSFMQSYQGWRSWMQNTVLFLPKILKLVLFRDKDSCQI